MNEVNVSEAGRFRRRSEATGEKKSHPLRYLERLKEVDKNE